LRRRLNPLLLLFSTGGQAVAEILNTKPEAATTFRMATDTSRARWTCEIGDSSRWEAAL
jgi:hypothetical protein